MPIFEYRCAGCLAETETIVVQGEKAPTACVDCGGKLVRRWSRVGTSFVGWGFAKNDALLPDKGDRRSFKEIKDKASELFD